MNMHTFTAMIKPASSLCNMRCRYCFYCDEAALRGETMPSVMTEETARNTIGRIYEAISPRAQVNFVFQGGEPTLAGLDFLRRFVAIAEEMNAKNARLAFSIQTNGLLIDETWAHFLAERDFLVGLSIDAGEQWHDPNRIDSAGQGTFARAMRAMRILKKAGARVNLLCVVTERMAAHPQAVFSAFQKMGAEYIQLIGCLPGLDGVRREYDLTGKSYAEFMKTIFRLWAQEWNKGNRLHIRHFENLISLARGEENELCGADGACTPQFVVESNGDIYPCDFFALEVFRTGNVHTHSVSDTLKSEGMARFMTDFIPRGEMCARCPVLPLCGGGCRRYRPFYQEQKGYCPQREFLTGVLSELIGIAQTHKP